MTPYSPRFLDQSLVWDAENQRYVPFKTLGVKQGQLPSKTKFESEIDLAWKDRSGKPKLNNFERKFADKTGLSVERYGNGSDTIGKYRPSAHRIVMNNKKNAGKQTFYHELGHSIDYRKNGVSTKEVKVGRIKQKRNSYNQLSKTKVFRGLPKQELSNTIIQRVKNSSSINFTDDETVKKYIAGKSVKINGKTYAGINKKYKEYIFNFDEIFADAYGQYRYDNANFVKYAPSISKYFDKLIQ